VRTADSYSQGQRRSAHHRRQRKAGGPAREIPAPL